MNLKEHQLLVDLKITTKFGQFILVNKKHGSVYNPHKQIWISDNYFTKFDIADIQKLNLKTPNDVKRFYIDSVISGLCKTEIIESDKSKSKAQRCFERLQVIHNFKNSRAMIPVNLTDDMIMAVMLRFKRHYDKNHIKPFNINIDIAYSIINTISTKYSYKKFNYRRKNKDDFQENDINKGWIQVKYSELVELSHIDCKYYLKALINSGYIETDNLWWHIPGAPPGTNKARCYKLADHLYQPNEKTHRFVDYQTYEIKLKIAKYKSRLRKESQIDNIKYQLLMDDVETLFYQIDEKQIYDYYKTRLHEFYETDGSIHQLMEKLNDPHIIKLNELIEFIEQTKANKNFYYNNKDIFGGRFHSILTNTPAKLRKFIRHNNIPYINVDIKNSQMAIIAIIVSHPDVAEELLKKCDEIEVNGLKIPLFEHYKNVVKEANVDLKLLQSFCNDAMTGVVYEKMADSNNADRSIAKLDAMKIFFSNNKQFTALKQEYGNVYPELIKLCNALNVAGGIHIIPKLTQQAESEIFINRVVNEFFKHKKYPAATVHDSIMVHPSDLELFDKCYNDVFNELGLNPLLLRYESSMTVAEAENYGFSYYIHKIKLQELIKDYPKIDRIIPEPSFIDISNMNINELIVISNYNLKPKIEAHRFNSLHI